MSLYSCGVNILKRISTLKSALVSPLLDAMYWIDSDYFMGMTFFDSVIKGVCPVLSILDMLKSTQHTVSIFGAEGSSFIMYHPLIWML